VPHRDPDTAARALDRLLADPMLRRYLGVNFRQQVEQQWSAAAIVPRWEALFDEVIGEREDARRQEQTDGSVSMEPPSTGTSL
jgi:hypothetical protein